MIVQRTDMQRRHAGVEIRSHKTVGPDIFLSYDGVENFQETLEHLVVAVPESWA